MGCEGRNERTNGMIWNPWKEIKRMREEISVTKERLETREYFAKSANEGRSQLIDVLTWIIAQETPKSNATVKLICKKAREALGV